MAEKDPGIIRIQENDYEEVPAKEVTIYLTIRGSSLFTGDAALSKAREVNQLVTELKTKGVEESKIQLLGVQADVTTGILGRNSSATYHLKVLCSQLDMLPDVLGIITSQKNTKVTLLEWGYGDLREVQERILDRCLERAQRKAQRIAGRLGVQILGISECTDGTESYEADVFQGEPEYSARGMGGRGASRRRETADLAMSMQMTKEDFGLQVSHSRRVFAGININYRVSDIQEPNRT
jgi:hypothetical protein